MKANRETAPTTCETLGKPVARLRGRRGGVRQAHHQYEPPAVAGLGVTRYRLHQGHRVLIWGENRTGRVCDAHISDWVRRIIER